MRPTIIVESTPSSLCDWGRWDAKLGEDVIRVLAAKSCEEDGIKQLQQFFLESEAAIWETETMFVEPLTKVFIWSFPVDVDVWGDADQDIWSAAEKKFTNEFHNCL